MTTYRKTHTSRWAIQQSRVLRSGHAGDVGLARWSVHLMRARYRYDGASVRRGWNLFLHLGGVRAEVGSR